MIGNDPGYQAWLAAIGRQSQIYKQQTDQARDALSYIAAPQNPASFGYPPQQIQSASNALMTQRANNPATALFGGTNPQAANYMLANYFASAPGGNTIGLPTDGNAIGGNQIDSSNALIAALLGRSGVG